MSDFRPALLNEGEGNLARQVFGINVLKEHIMQIFPYMWSFKVESPLLSTGPPDPLLIEKEFHPGHLPSRLNTFTLRVHTIAWLWGNSFFSRLKGAEHTRSKF